MLLLRQMCEASFAKYNIQDFHIQRNTTQKCLSIVGPCGAELVTIYGISIPANLKPAEREYAAELFEAFLKKNHKAILEFIQKKQEFKAMSIPVTPTFCYGSYPGSTYLPGGIRLGSENYNELKVLLKQEIQDECDMHIVAFNACKQTEKELQTLQSNLSSCSI